MALCGGVTCILEPTLFVTLSKAKMISSDGTSKPFSSKANGYGRGEGCGVILLKPLKKVNKKIVSCKHCTMTAMYLMINYCKKHP